MKRFQLAFWLLLALIASIVADVIVRHYDVNCAIHEATALSPEKALLVTSMRLVRSGDASELELRKVEGEWQMASPFACPADPVKVMKLIDALTWTRVRDSLSARECAKLGRNRDDFGLVAPALSLEVGFVDGSCNRIDFGSIAETKDAVYVHLGDDAIHVIGREVWDASSVSPDEFRLRSLARFDLASVIALDIRRGPEMLRFSREGEFWELRSPCVQQANAEKIRAFLESLAAVEVESFIWPSLEEKTFASTELSAALLASYGLDEDNAVTVSLKLADGKDVQVVFGREISSGHVAAYSPLARAVVSIPAELRAVAQSEISVFSESRLFPMAEKDVKRIAIVNGVDSLLLSLGIDGHWLMDAPVSAPADDRAVGELIGRLLVLKHTDLAAKGVEVSVGTNTAPVVVSETALFGEGGAERLRSREIINFNPGSVRRITVTDSKGTSVAVVFDGERSVWDVESSDVEGVVDTVAVEAIMRTLSPLIAHSVVQLRASADDLRSFGLENPWRVLAFDRRAGDGARVNLLIGSCCATGRYATLGTSEAVFVISNATVEELSRNPIEHR